MSGGFGPATENVFAPPKADLETRTEPGELWQMPFKDLKKLRSASESVRALAFLFGLSALGGLLLGLGSLGSHFGMFEILFTATGLLSLAACVGAIQRRAWGRPVGILVCALSLANVPLGTIIGALGLAAYLRGKRLFGPDRLLHADVIAVYKARKIDKK